MDSPSPHIKKLTLVISSLGPGGAERVMATLANSWANAGTAVTLITLSQNHTDHYPLHPTIRRVILPIRADRRTSLLRSILANLQRVLALRRAIRAADSGITLSFIDRTNVLALLATLGLPERVFVSERCHILKMQSTLGLPWRLLRKVLYPRAQCVIVQTAAQAAALTGSNFLGARIVVLPNPLSTEVEGFLAPSTPANPPRIVAMGRLAHQKGFDLLIEAFAEVAKINRSIQLIIWGEGPERERLTDLIAATGLQKQIHLPGVTSQPLQELAQADIFVLPSRFEGFPNVLLEAMALGRACVAFDCPFGPWEISDQGNAALVVQDGEISALAEGINLLLTNPLARAEMGAKAAASVRRHYAVSAVLQGWTAILMNKEGTS